MITVFLLKRDYTLYRMARLQIEPEIQVASGHIQNPAIREKKSNLFKVYFCCSTIYHCDI